MYVTSSAIENGRILDRYGSRGTQFDAKGMPTYSMSFEIHDVPEGTGSFAVIFDDDDAVRVCGFTWVHWLIADLKRTKVEENESVSAKDFSQGVNSCHSCAGNSTVQEASGYGGPAPPDKEHLYTLKVFALDRKTGLKDGFYLNDLKRAMDGHVLAHAKIAGLYKPKE